jgi:quercetin dioxygenase-like cupin family protein
MSFIASTHFALSRRDTLRVLGLLGVTAAAGTYSRTALAHQESDDPLAGTTIEQLSGGMPGLVPDHALVLLRVTMEPGVVIPPHSHPGPVALYVEQGTFGTEFIEGSGTVQPQPQNGTPVPAIDLAPGDDILMPAGDNLFYDGAVHTMRNDGDDTLILLVAAVFDPSAPGFQWQGATATPAG